MAIAALAQNTTPGPLASVQHGNYLDLPALWQTLAGPAIGALVDTPTHAGPVAVCLALFGECQYAGRPTVPYAIWHSLYVQPGFRRRGSAQ